MKLLTDIIKTILGMVFIAFCAIVATFFISIFYAEGVIKALEVFKSLM